MHAVKTDHESKIKFSFCVLSESKNVLSQIDILIHISRICYQRVVSI